MNKKNIFLMLCLVSSYAFGASDVYRYTGKDGSTVYTDKNPRAKKNVGILSKQTGVIKNISELEEYQEYQKLTDNEKEEIEKKKKNEIAQAKKDEILLNKYSTVDELEKMRDYELEQFKRSISNDKNIIETLSSQRELLQKDFNKNNKNKVLEKEIQRLSESILAAEKNKEKTEKILDERNALYSSDKERLIKVLNYLDKEKNN